MLLIEAKNNFITFFFSQTSTWIGDIVKQNIRFFGFERAYARLG